MARQTRRAYYRGMNESDVQEAWDRFQLHPVLGPAARTMANLVDMTNANSDGWPYWRKPSDAAAGLQNMIMRAMVTGRPGEGSATAEEYKRALRPLKAFRTRMLRSDQQGRHISPSHRQDFNFDIVEPHGPGMSGELWVAQLELADAIALHEAAARREQAMLELCRRAGFAVRETEQRIRAAGFLAEVELLREQHGDDPKLAKLALLARPGTRVWLCGGAGLGQAATSLGVMQGSEPHRRGDDRWDYALVSVRPDGARLDQDDKRLYATVILTVADAAERWWIVSADGRELVSGGHRDRDRMLALRDEKFPGCLVQQGAQFIPEGELRAAGVEPVRQEVAL